MRKLFLVSCVVAAVLPFGGAGLVAQQQGSGSSGNPAAQSAASSADGQATSTSNDVPSPDTPDAAPNAQDQNADKTTAEKSRAQRAKEHVKKQMSSWCVNSPVNHCWEKKPSDQAKDTSAQSPVGRAPRSDDQVTPPPTAVGESSSKDTKVDLSPPVGEANDQLYTAGDVDEAGEFHAWDPHRAMKNVEVGDYYYKRGNYRAAVSRYQEALQWKPKDAEATFKLADSYDKLGDIVDARDNYEKYLGILPKGPRADDVKKALARLK